MITDILNKPLKLDIEGNCYNLEFDNKAYGMLEQEISKGICSNFDLISLISCSL